MIRCCVRDRTISLQLKGFKPTYRGSQELEGTLFPAMTMYSSVSGSVGASDPMTNRSTSSGLLSLENWAVDVSKNKASHQSAYQQILGDGDSIFRILESSEACLKQTDFLILCDLLILALYWHASSDLGHSGHDRCCWVGGFVLETSPNHGKKVG